MGRNRHRPVIHRFANILLRLRPLQIRRTLVDLGRADVERAGIGHGGIAQRGLSLGWIETNGYDFYTALIPKYSCCSKARRSYYFESRSISLKHERTKINGFIKR